MEPDLDADVSVRHMKADDTPGATGGDRWIVSLGREPRSETGSAQHAFLFARLLADLAQRRVWIVHDDRPAEPLDARTLGGCSCC